MKMFFYTLALALAVISANQATAQTFLWSLPNEQTQFTLFQTPGDPATKAMVCTLTTVSFWEVGADTPYFTYIDPGIHMDVYKTPDGAPIIGDFTGAGHNQMAVQSWIFAGSTYGWGFRIIDMVTGSVALEMLPATSPEDITLRQIMDVNGDGLLDAAIQHRNNLSMVWYRVYTFGDGTSAAPQTKDARTAKLDVSPNPSSNQVALRLNVPTDERVEVSVYDVSGRKVDTVKVWSKTNAGLQNLTWSPSQGSSGVYYIHAHGETFQLSSQAIVIR